MARTKASEGLSRQNASTRRITRSSTRRNEPPLVISEPQHEPHQASTSRSKAAQKRKGKETAVERENSDSDDETLRNVLFESRQMAENQERLFGTDIGGSSAQDYEYVYSDNEEEDPVSDTDAWYNDPELESDYLDTDAKKEKFYELVNKGSSRSDAYVTMEKHNCRRHEGARRRRLVKEDATDAFYANEFEGTYYYDTPTLRALDIEGGFHALAHQNVVNFLMKEHDTYIEETVHFLTTVVVHRFNPQIEALQETHGGGYITFQVKDTNYKVSIKQIQRHFGFQEGTTSPSEVDKQERNAVWSLLTGRPVYAGSNDKGNWIRNPAVSYFRRAVANTFYARNTTGNVVTGELDILVTAIKRIAPRIHGQELQGDTANSGLAYTLANHLMEYRSRAIKQAKSSSTKKRRCSIGGVVCSLMSMAGVQFSELQSNGKPNNMGRRYMDIDYLQRVEMLHKGSKTDHFYRFLHPQRDEAYIRLPSSDWTELMFSDIVRNLEFVPPLTLLVDPTERIPSPAQDTDAEIAEDEAPEPMTPPRRRGSKRTSFLERMQKGMLKSIRRLIGKNRENERRITTLETANSGHETRITTLESENRELRSRHSISHPGGTSAPFAHHTSPTRHSFAGTEHYQQREHGGPSYDPDNTGNDSPY